MDYSKFKLDELKELARSRNIEGRSRKNKADLINLLRDNDQLMQRNNSTRIPPVLSHVSSPIIKSVVPLRPPVPVSTLVPAPVLQSAVDIAAIPANKIKGGG